MRQREGYPHRDHQRRGQPPRLLAAFGSHFGACGLIGGISARGGEHPPGPSLRLVPHARERLRERDLIAHIAEKGRPAPLQSGQRWVSERTNSWHNAHKKLVWCTEKVGRVIDFWVAFSEVVIIVRRLIREGWMRYRWEGRPPHRP